jgi:hypothetical protein
MDVIQEGDRVSFSFSSRSGPVRTVSLCVFDASKRKVLWQLGSIGLANVLQAKMDPALERRTRIMVARSVPPDEMTLLLAIKLFGSTANKVIKTVTYGEVPKGFLQDYPTLRAPQPLRPHQTYTLCLFGAFKGYQSFAINEPSAERRRTKR